MTGFQWGNATIRAREITIGDEEDIGTLMLRVIPETELRRGAAYAFSEFMIAAEVDGELPVPMITLDSTDSEIRASFAQFRKLPRRFIQQWRAEMQAVETDPKP